MKGSVFALLGCFALFFAAPSRSYSIPEDDRSANRRDAQSGGQSTEAAAFGDAGESETIGMDGGANPGNETVAGDARAEKSEIRKRDTRSFVRDETDSFQVTVPPINKEVALSMLMGLGDSFAVCFKEACDYIDVHEIPIGVSGFYDPVYSFTRSDMVKWLEIIKDSMSECMMRPQSDIIAIKAYRDGGTPDPVGSDKFADRNEFWAPLKYIGKKLKECFEDAIAYLKSTLHGPKDTLQRSSQSLSDILMDLIIILSGFDGTGVPPADTVPMSPPGHTGQPYLDPAPVITSYKKRNSPYKPGGYPHYSNLPGSVHPWYLYGKGAPNSIVRQISGFRQEGVQTPDTPIITTLPEDVHARPTHQLSLLDTVLDKIYAALQGKGSPAVNTDAAPVEGLRADEDGSQSGNGEGGGLDPRCVHKRSQRRAAHGG